jgi:glutaredoxin
MRSTGLAGTEAEPLSMLAARAFEHIRLHRGARAALRYLAEVNELRKDDDDPFEENQTDSLRAPNLSDFATAFKRAWARSASRRSASDGEKQWQALQHSLEHESTVLSNVEYIEEKGIATFPTLIFNGIVTGMSTQYSLPEEALMQMDKESMRLYELVREGRLRDGENALKALVRKEGLPKHNQRILSRMRSDDTLCVIHSSIEINNSMRICDRFVRLLLQDC